MKAILAAVLALVAVAALSAQGVAFRGTVKALNAAQTQFSIGPDVTVSVRNGSVAQTFLREASQSSEVRIVIEQIFSE